MPINFGLSVSVVLEIVFMVNITCGFPHKQNLSILKHHARVCVSFKLQLTVNTFLIWFWGIIKIFLHLALIRHFEKNRILSELRL